MSWELELALGSNGCSSFPKFSPSLCPPLRAISVFIHSLPLNTSCSAVWAGCCLNWNYIKYLTLTSVVWLRIEKQWTHTEYWSLFSATPNCLCLKILWGSCHGNKVVALPSSQRPAKWSWKSCLLQGRVHTVTKRGLSQLSGPRTYGIRAYVICGRI